MSEKTQNVVNKLIVLFILQKLEVPLNSMVLMKICLENKFVDYFSFQQVLSELLNTGFVENNSFESNECISITEAGLNSLGFFFQRIPSDVKFYIENNLSLLKNYIKQESLITSNILEKNGEFIVNCNFSEENFSLFDIKLTVGTRKDAQLISNNWNAFSQHIYPEIILAMTKNRT